MEKVSASEYVCSRASCARLTSSRQNSDPFHRTLDEHFSLKRSCLRLGALELALEFSSKLLVKHRTSGTAAIAASNLDTRARAFEITSSGVGPRCPAADGGWVT